MSDGSPAGELPFVAPCRRLHWRAPLGWLGLGWQDLRRAPLPSLSYGVAIFVVSAVVSGVAWRYGSGWMLLVMLSSFVFVAPVLALGLYAISAALQRGERPSLRTALLDERGRLGDALVYSLVLLVICLVWMRAGTGVQIFYPQSGTPTRMQLIGFFAIGSAVGSIFALIAFAASAFSLPMLLDRRVDGITAVVTSINAVLRNTRAMLLWIALIVAAVGIGFATALVGLVVTMPLIGHATWHAYQETIDASAFELNRRSGSAP
ncbi:MAG: DUF2189 domain-containing protein [Steroidobacteraceae bacterium]|nr:DUF2189 domain-containing protein [Steroidobacteraceae bacterium]MDW8260648.1 DUF2189 domain-containing protein [Gammaproteobacteria bacterium]